MLDLNNRYGNSYIGKLNGKLTAEIKYGDLRTEVIANDADLSLGYGKASIAKVNHLYGQVSDNRTHRHGSRGSATG